MASHRVRGVGLAVSNEHFTRWGWYIFEPAHHFFPIRVRRKAADLFDPASNRNPLPEDLYLLFAVEDALAQSARGLITHKNYNGIFVLHQPQRMMKYAASIHHS